MSTIIQIKPGSTASITPDQIKKYQDAFRSAPANRVSMNAMTSVEAEKVGLNRSAVTGFPMTFTTELKSGAITAQEKSGRCWMFAALNAMRMKVMEKLDLDSFELSQSYIMFWDKFERCNYHLEAVLETLDEPLDSRLMMWLLNNPLKDGGQWDMFANLVEKYGVVPKHVYPESISSSSTRIMNGHLNEKLREYTCQLRNLHHEGHSISSLRSRKLDMLETLYRILAIHNGEPPAEFTWSWRDSKNVFHEHDGPVSPGQFLDDYVGINLDDYVSLIHCPTDDKPLDRQYEIEYLGNVVDGRPIRYLNLDIDILKQVTQDSLEAGEPVWFGCDVGKDSNREHGIMDVAAYQFDLLYSTPHGMDKAQRVSFGHSRMTHAMLFTGVHVEAGRPVRWKVENSWGTEAGRQGFLVMSNRWFDEYLFQVLVHRKFVAAEKLKILDEEPIRLRPWDPMGALA